jgi:hypothetical protein
MIRYLLIGCYNADQKLKKPTTDSDEWDKILHKTSQVLY